MGMVMGMKGTVKGCGSSWDRVLGMKVTSKGCGSSADVVIEYDQRDEGYRHTVWSEGLRLLAKGKNHTHTRGSWDGIIGMKGTSKGCGSSRDVVIGCGQKDKVYQERAWFLWGWGNRV